MGAAVFHGTVPASADVVWPRLRGRAPAMSIHPLFLPSVSNPALVCLYVGSIYFPTPAVRRFYVATVLEMRIGSAVRSNGLLMRAPSVQYSTALLDSVHAVGTGGVVRIQ